MVEIKAIIGEREKHTIEAYYSMLTGKSRVVVDGKEIVNDKLKASSSDAVKLIALSKTLNITVSKTALLYKFSVGDLEKHEVELMLMIGPDIYLVVDGKKIENQKKVPLLLRPAHNEVQRFIEHGKTVEKITPVLIIPLGIVLVGMAVIFDLSFGVVGFLFAPLLLGLVLGINVKVSDADLAKGIFYIVTFGSIVWLSIWLLGSAVEKIGYRPYFIIYAFVPMLILAFIGAFVGKILKGKSPNPNVS